MMLESLLRSKVTVKLLTLFLSNPEGEFYIRQLERELEEPVSAVRRELGRLESAGLISSQKRGNLKFHKVNLECPVYPELKSLFFKTEGIGKYLAEHLEELGRIQVAFVYGSFAEDTAKLDSDIDLMIVGDVNTDAVSKVVNRAEKELRREINYISYEPGEFEELRKSKLPFMSNVLAGKKIILVGTLENV
jgi:predicted nucleotidyltransferase